MKILHIIPSMEIGGAQRLLSDLLPILIKGNDVKLLVFKKIGTTFERIVESYGIQIINLDCKKIYNPKIIFRLIPYLKQCDIAHIHLFPSLYWSAFASLFCKTKLVYTEHSTHNKRRNKPIFRFIERYVYGRYSKVISISKQTQNALTLWLYKAPVDNSRFLVIENGVNIKNFETDRHVDSGSRKQIIMVSRFAEMKDQETVIRAMVHISEDARLVFVGDGPNKSYCESISNKLGLSERIVFLGARDDIPKLVGNAYIGVQSSVWEGFGLTAVELMAAKKPVVATNVDGLRQIVENAGCLFDVGDTVTLASHINHLLNDEEYYRIVADKCFERAKQYDITIMADKYQHVYNSLYEQKKD